MADSGQKALSGAAQGAAAGASFGPWGALIGGVAGGAMGYLQGDDPTAPNYQPGAPPSIPGGTSGQYGGMYYDPTTGSTQSLSYGFDPTQMGNQIQNQSLYNQLIGQGNEGMTNNLDFQLQSLQQQLARLQSQQGGTTGIGSQKSFKDYIGQGSQMWMNPDGSPIDLSSKEALLKNAALTTAFHDATASSHGTYGKGGNDFMRWVNDAAKNAGIPDKIKAWQQTQDVNVGNSDQRNQAIQALQNQIQYIGKAKEQAGAAPTNNPMMNFLNQRNMDPNGGDYSGKYIDPWTQKMSDEASLYQDASHKNYNQTLNPDGSVKSQSEMGVPDAKGLTARMEANFKGNGAFGGERMGPMGAYDGSKVGDFIANLNRVAERSNVSNQALAAENAARRGVLGGSAGETGRLAAEQSLADTRALNAGQGYSLDATDRNNWFNQKFAIDQHNSDVAKTGAQFSANGLNQILQNGFGNEMTAAQFYEGLKQQGFANNQSEQQRNYGNTMGTQGQSSALGQLTLNNQRYDQGLDQQNFTDRMSLANMLQGQTQQGFQNDLSKIGVNNAQAGIGNQVGQFNANNTNQYNAANAAGQNAQNVGQWQSQVNSNAATQQAVGQAAQGLGAAWGQYNSQPTQVNYAQGGIPGGTNTSLFSGATNTNQNMSNPGVPTYTSTPGGTSQNLFSGASYTNPYTPGGVNQNLNFAQTIQPWGK